MKTTWATWKAYLDSWPDGQWYDDADVTINKVTEDDFNEKTVPANAIVEVTMGVVIDELHSDGRDLVRHFKAWERSLTRTNVLVDVPKEKQEELKVFLKSIGGKVVTA